MTHTVEKRNSWCHRFSLSLVVLMAFVTPVCWWTIRQVRVENDIEKWLPHTDPEVRAFDWAHQQFSIEERILLTWDGSSINDARIGKLVEQLVGKSDDHGIKRGGLPYVSSVIEPRQALNVMQDNGIEPQEAARRLEGTILGAGALRLQLTETGRSSLKKTKRELQKALHSQFGIDLVIHDPSPDLTPMIAIPAPDDSPSSPIEPAHPAVLSPEGKLIDFPNLEHDLQISWRGIRVGSERTIEIARWLCEFKPERSEGVPLVENCFFAIGSPIALAVGISESGLADKAETVAAIRSASKLAGIPDDALHLTGGVISASDLNTQILKSVWDTSFPLMQIQNRSVFLTSVLVCAVLAFLVLRNIRLATLVLLVSLFTAYCALGLVPATGGTLNMILVLMPMLLIAATMSRAIQFTNYWKHTGIHENGLAITEAARFARIPTFMAGLCCAVGLISFCTSSLSPVRDFGIYAATGTVISLLVLAFGLPALMQLWPGPVPQEQDRDQQGWRTFGRILSVQSGAQALAVIAILLGCSFGLSQLRFENQVTRNFAEATRVARDYWFVETNLSGTMPVETVIRFDEQSQKDTNFLDRMELIRQVQDKMWAHPDISGTISLADFQPVSESPAEDAGFLQKSKHNKKATMIQQRIRDGEITNGKFYYTISERGHDLKSAGDQLLNQPGDELWRVTAHVNAMAGNDFSRVLTDLHEITREVLKLQPGSQHAITGAVSLLSRIQQATQQSLIGSIGITIAFTFVVLMIRLRRVGGALLAMVPTLLPVAATFGAYSWLDQRIELGTMLVASITLGMAVDGTLHYLSWVHLAMSKGRTRNEALIDALACCGPALWRSSGVVAIAALALIPAELRLISRFGGLMASSMGIVLICEVVLLPQLLASPLGWLLEPMQSRAQEPVATIQPQISGPQSSVVADPIDEVNSPPAPHIKPMDTNRKKRRPTA